MKVDTPKAGLRDTCSGAELSKILKMSQRNLREWAQRGVLVRAAIAGRYRTESSIHAYIEALREQAAGRTLQSSSNRTLAQEKAEDVRIGRQIKELKLAQIQGEVLTLEEITESWAAFAASVKGSFLALPGKARRTIPHLTAHDGETLKRICRDSLTELSKEVRAIVIGGDAEKTPAGKLGWPDSEPTIRQGGKLNTFAPQSGVADDRKALKAVVQRPLVDRKAGHPRTQAIGAKVLLFSVSNALADYFAGASSRSSTTAFFWPSPLAIDEVAGIPW